MGRRPRNDGLTMTTFHLQKRDRGRRIHKTANANAFNFTRQIARSNCTAIFTKCDKSRATMFNTWCKSTVVCYRFYRVEALPLDSTRFLRLAKSSPLAARSPARRPRDDRQRQPDEHQVKINAVILNEGIQRIEKAGERFEEFNFQIHRFPFVSIVSRSRLCLLPTPPARFSKAAISEVQPAKIPGPQAR